MNDIAIRPATLDDLPALVTWNAAMAQETESKQLDRDVLAGGVAAVFEQPRRGFYLIAERAGAVGLRLYVETENARAQRTYAELGMTECHYRMYEQAFVQGR